MNPIEQHALYILKLLVDEDRKMGTKEIKELTHFEPRDISDAIEYLENRGYIDVLRGIGGVAIINANSSGRYQYHEIFSESRESIIDPNNPSSFEELRQESSTDVKNSFYENGIGVEFMVNNNKITREKLNDVVNYYMENGDFKTARNHIKSWGEHIDDFNINEELKKFDEGQYLPEFWSLIHQDIIKVSKKLFEDKHYAHSVESAFKEVNSRVKKIYTNKTGDEKDGSDLMMNAFKFDKNRKQEQINKPIIQLTALNSISDKDIQNGYRFIFAGSIMAFRNPKAHENQKITKEEAIHSIFIASKLMHRLDDSNY